MTYCTSAGMRPTVQKPASRSMFAYCRVSRDEIQTNPKDSATPPRDPHVPGAFGRYPRPNAVAMASETRGLRAVLFVVVFGMLALGWLIRLVLDLFRFRFVHHRHG